MNKCELHGVTLEPGRCEIRRGMPPAPPEGYWEAEESLFPNANSWGLGGCVLTAHDEDDEPTEFCPECREAERKWEQDHPIDDFWRAPPG